MLSRVRLPHALIFGGAILLVAVLAAVPVPGSAHAADSGEQLAQHRDRLGVTAWHTAGYRGQGVKVAVLDSDFHGYDQEHGLSLPWRLRAKSFREDNDIEAPGSGHGLRAAQVVHALAPRAELLLVNWEPGDPEQFFQAVRWALEQGARIITCSVTTGTWGDGEGGGPHHARLSRLLGKGNKEGQPLLFCSAGNVVRGHWGGPYHRNAAGLHQWKPGVTDNTITPQSKTPVRISLMHKPGAVYQIQLFENDNKVPFAQYKSDPSGSLASTAVRFTPEEGKRYRLRLRLVDGKAKPFHLIARPGSLGITTLRNSICSFPADNPAVVTVGAVDWLDKRAVYSASGSERKHKPEVVAPVPFPCPGRAAGFNGTSAAAPQAAGLAALLMEKNPRWNARQIRAALLTEARPLAKRGSSNEYGHGRLWLPRPEK